MGGRLWAHKRLVLLPILLRAGSLVGNGGEGQLVVLYDVDPILVLVFLHVEHFSEFFQLVELTEGFQNYQHGNEAKEEVTWVRRKTASQWDRVTDDFSGDRDSVLLN